MRRNVVDRGELVVPVRQHEADDAVNRRVERVVENDVAAGVQHLIDVEEIDERVIEGVPAVDEADLAAIAGVDEPRKAVLRRLLAQFDDVRQTRTRELPKARTVPRIAVTLRRIERDQLRVRTRDAPKSIGDTDGGNAERHPDLHALPRAAALDDVVQQRARLAADE